MLLTTLRAEFDFIDSFYLNLQIRSFTFFEYCEHVNWFDCVNMNMNYFQ